MNKFKYVEDFASNKIKNIILAARNESTYIDVQFDNYVWTVLKSIKEGKYYLLAYSPITEKVFLEEYDLINKTAQYFGSIPYIEVKSNYLKGYSSNLVSRLSKLELCEFVRNELDSALEDDAKVIQNIFTCFDKEKCLTLSKYRVRKIYLKNNI